MDQWASLPLRLSLHWPIGNRHVDDDEAVDLSNKKRGVPKVVSPRSGDSPPLS